MEFISTDKAPEAIGPYSQAIKTGNMLFLSGQIPLDPTTGKIVFGGIKEQTKQVLANIEEVLGAGESSKDQVVKTTIYLTDLIDFNDVNEVYDRFFRGHKPARSTVQVSALPKGARIEIDAIALIT